MVWDTNLAAVSLFLDTNMAAVTSCEDTLYHSEENGMGFFKSFFPKPDSQLWSLFFLIFCCYFCGFMNSLAFYIDLLYVVSVAYMPLINRQWGPYTGAPNVNFRKISVRKTIWDLEFSEHLLQSFLLACIS